jgi:pyridinium-3,5-bisthiocarboxylic acid mononucleotide nickel chelatase
VRIVYFDCVAGISGDMALGALTDAGADFEELHARLTSLPIEPFSLDRDEVETAGLRATKVTVRAGTRGVIRTYASIRALLDAADLPADVRNNAQRIFRRLAEAEARVHRKEVDLVTFHELGEVDCIVDITGTALALSMLGVERVFSSPVPTGLGMVRTEHGAMPIPGPTVVELLRGVPLYSRGVPIELVTPTGAAILAALAEGYGDVPLMRVEATGYGARASRADFPDVLRVLVGPEEARAFPGLGWHVAGPSTVRFNIEGVEPPEFEEVLERAFAAGASDAWLTPVMTRAGPGVRVEAVCPPGREESIRLAVLGLSEGGEGGEGGEPTPTGVGPDLRLIKSDGDDPNPT